MYMYVADPEDLQAYEDVKTALITYRRISGAAAKDLSLAHGRGEQFVYSMEKGLRDSPLLSSIQAWAATLDCRVEFGLENFWLHSHHDAEMATMYLASREWGADAMCRLWLVSALRQWRIKQGVDVEHLAPLLGVTNGAVRDWEAGASDPVLKRVMVHARALGTRLTMQVWPRSKWTFGA